MCLGDIHNGYCHTAAMPGPGTGNVTLTSADYQTGLLGRFYYPTNGTNLNSLRDVGSRNGDVACLYHYTTTTNQVKETNSVVDIGFHSIAADVNGQPADGDGDGVADYLEDLSGNGLVNSGETAWNDPADIGLRVKITRPNNGAKIP